MLVPARIKQAACLPGHPFRLDPLIFNQLEFTLNNAPIDNVVVADAINGYVKTTSALTTALVRRKGDVRIYIKPQDDRYGQDA